MLSKEGGEEGGRQGGGREAGGREGRREGVAVGREHVSLGAKAETTLWWLVATLALTQPAEAKASNKEKDLG